MTKPLAEWSASQLRAAAAKADATHSVILDEMIATGRGHERPTETMKKDDPLSRRFIASMQRVGELEGERRRRLEYHGSERPIRRKGNPIMATAKQIAARKEFARIMKSGGFGAARKRAAPKRRKANPIARHPGGGVRSGSGFFAPQMTPEAVRGMAGAKRRRKNPVSGGGRMTHPRMSEKQAMNDPGGYRDMNPKRRTTSQRNEGSKGYHVEAAVKAGGSWRRIATFGKLPEAKSYALALGSSNPRRSFRVIKT